MPINRRSLMLAALAGAAVWPCQAEPEGALIAVATNFTNVAEQLKLVFEAESGFELTIASGSTGKLYAQILNGAPYDALLAADQTRPLLLEELGHGHGRITYARGLLTLWQPDSDDISQQSLIGGSFEHLAMANPELAPYGLAALETLMALGLWEELQKRVVMGQNVGQAFALVASGNAELGLVAQSYALGHDGAGWLVPERLYNPILQDAILLGSNPAAAAFLDFLASDTAQEIILGAGYGEVNP